jgi:hypothetical protein
MIRFLIKQNEKIFEIFTCVYLEGTHFYQKESGAYVFSEPDSFFDTLFIWLVDKQLFGKPLYRSLADLV